MPDGRRGPGRGGCRGEPGRTRSQPRLRGGGPESPQLAECRQQPLTIRAGPGGETGMRYELTGVEGGLAEMTDAGRMGSIGRPNAVEVARAGCVVMQAGNRGAPARVP